MREFPFALAVAAWGVGRMLADRNNPSYAGHFGSARPRIMPKAKLTKNQRYILARRQARANNTNNGVY